MNYSQRAMYGILLLKEPDFQYKHFLMHANNDPLYTHAKYRCNIYRMKKVQNTKMYQQQSI